MSGQVEQTTKSKVATWVALIGGVRADVGYGSIEQVRAAARVAGQRVFERVIRGKLKLTNGA